jgi:hypothetical protein
MNIDQGVTKWDLALIAGIIVFSACWWWMHGPAGGREPSMVEVYSGTRLIAELPADRDVSVKVPGPRGTSIVEIRSGKARMVSSPCPDKLCVSMGRISSPGESVLCIPNQVLVTVKSRQGQIDAVTY